MVISRSWNSFLYLNARKNICLEDVWTFIYTFDLMTIRLILRLALLRVDGKKFWIFLKVHELIGSWIHQLRMTCFLKICLIYLTRILSTLPWSKKFFALKKIYFKFYSFSQSFFKFSSYLNFFFCFIYSLFYRIFMEILAAKNFATRIKENLIWRRCRLWRKLIMLETHGV